MELVIEVLGTVALTLGPFFGPPLVYHAWKALKAA